MVLRSGSTHSLNESVMPASKVNSPEYTVHSNRKKEGISEGQQISKRDCPSPQHAGRNAASSPLAIRPKIGIEGPFGTIAAILYIRKYQRIPIDIQTSMSWSSLFALNEHILSDAVVLE